jgi:hypothetical protein
LGHTLALVLTPCVVWFYDLLVRAGIAHVAADPPQQTTGEHAAPGASASAAVAEAAFFRR